MAGEQQHALSTLLSINKLNELLKRADSSSNKLKTDLDDLLLNSYSKINIKQDFTQNSPNKRKETCSIYIEFYQKLTNMKICHLSLHFDPRCQTKGQKYHVKNNTNKNRYHTLKINIQKQYFSLNILPQPQKIREEVYECTTALEIVLRQYLSNDTDLSLSKPLTQIQFRHACMNRILGALRHSKSQINKTRKRYIYSKELDKYK